MPNDNIPLRSLALVEKSIPGASWDDLASLLRTTATLLDESHARAVDRNTRTRRLIGNARVLEDNFRAFRSLVNRVATEMKAISTPGANPSLQRLFANAQFTASTLSEALDMPDSAFKLDYPDEGLFPLEAEINAKLDQPEQK
jgi:hypothetical protein